MTATGGGVRPLDGRCVLVTRPRAQAAELIALLEAAGARVVVAPTVCIVPPSDPVPLQHAAANLAEFDWIVFSSGNAVDALLDGIPRADAAPNLPAMHDADTGPGPDGAASVDSIANAGAADSAAALNSSANGNSTDSWTKVARSWPGLGPGSGPATRSGAEAAGPRNAGRTEVLPKVAAVGSRTAARLRARGLDVALVPDEFTAEGLVTAMTATATVAGARVLLPRSEIGRDVIAEGLRSAGAIVTEVIAYRTVAEEQGNEVAIVRQLLAEHRLDAITFTSGSAVQNFVRAYGPEVVGRIRDTVVAVIGPVTADAARQLGLAVQVQPATYTAADMVDALAQHFAATRESGASETRRA